MRLQVIRIFAIFALMSSTTHIPTAAANDQPPTADWSHSEGSATTFMAGTYVVFDGSLSHDNDENGNSINYYVWYVDGMVKFQGSSASSFGWTFALETGDTQQSVQIKLRVRDDEGSWDSYTRSYTIRQEPGRAYYVKDHVPAPRSFSVGEENVRVTVDENGNAIGWDDYYPFGKVMPGRSSNNANPNDVYKYIGVERDREANLNLDYMSARYYDSEIGRFLQIDPLANHPNQIELTPCNYSWNNPTNLSDPSGECPLCLGATFGIVADVAVQTFEIAMDDNKTLQDFSTTSVIISGAAGATGVGLVSKINKMGKLAKVATELAFDASGSAATQFAKNGEVNVSYVTIDAITGQTAGKVAGNFVEGKFLNSKKGGIMQSKVNEQKNALLGKSNTISKTKANVEGAKNNLIKAKAARGG